MYLLNSSSKWTLPLSVYNFYGQFSRSWNLVCADVVLVSLPVILVYIFAQKWVIAGMTAGAVKADLLGNYIPDCTGKKKLYSRGLFEISLTRKIILV